MVSANSPHGAGLCGGALPGSPDVILLVTEVGLPSAESYSSGNWSQSLVVKFIFN